MYISVGMNILNIIGNSIFLYGLLGAPKMGVTGVAIATVISQAVGVVAMLIVMLTGLNQKFFFPGPCAAAVGDFKGYIENRTSFCG